MAFLQKGQNPVKSSGLLKLNLQLNPAAVWLFAGRPLSIFSKETQPVWEDWKGGDKDMSLD